MKWWSEVSQHVFNRHSKYFYVSLDPTFTDIDPEPSPVTELDWRVDAPSHALLVLAARDAVVGLIAGADTPKVVVADPSTLADAVVMSAPVETNMLEDAPAVDKIITEPTSGVTSSPAPQRNPAEESSFALLVVMTKGDVVAPATDSAPPSTVTTKSADSFVEQFPFDVWLFFEGAVGASSSASPPLPLGMKEAERCHRTLRDVSSSDAEDKALIRNIDLMRLQAIEAIRRVL
ncbi:hypothetical protein GUJ93_ZPchr0003g18197 [Zizania palustris]|uniref:Uncharacterized protein n=1 Tax=Zizania palustris TaxID=103762 RepID=A0A8J5S6G3_ZIZPA|nr:hypothetical protein GUJ93_ZPchr0003g18197 [Zizania palustris]